VLFDGPGRREVAGGRHGWILARRFDSAMSVASTGLFWALARHVSDYDDSLWQSAGPAFAPKRQVL